MSRVRRQPLAAGAFTESIGMDEDTRQKLGERLRNAREYLGLSQEEVAKRLGVPRSAVSLMEAGRRKVEALELTKLASLYQCPVADLTGQAERPTLPKQLEVLTRTASELTETDQAEVLRFAEFLRARSQRQP